MFLPQDGGGPIEFSTRCKSVRQGQQGHLGGASWILYRLNLRLSTWRTLLLLRPPDTLFLHRHHSWSGRLFGVSMARARRGRRTGAPFLGESCRRVPSIAPPRALQFRVRMGQAVAFAATAAWVEERGNSRRSALPVP